MAEMMTPPAAGPALPMKRSTRWILIGSLAVNFLVAGVLIGAAVANHGDRMPRYVELATGPFARSLDEEDRRAIARELMLQRDVRPPSRAARAAELAELVAALKADPYQHADVAAIVERQGTWIQAAQAAAQQAVLARIGAMTPEARLAFADRLGREMAHDGRGGGPERWRDAGPAGD